jgi:hypothetical protein
MAANAEGVNNKKTQHDFVNFGTPAIHPLVVVRNDEGDFTGHADNNSDFHKVMTILQTRMEIYAVGAVSGTTFTLMVVDNTLAADAGNERAPTSVPDLDYLQNEVLAGCGVGVRIYNGKIVGSGISYDDC